MVGLFYYLGIGKEGLPDVVYQDLVSLFCVVCLFLNVRRVPLIKSMESVIASGDFDFSCRIG